MNPHKSLSPERVAEITASRSYWLQWGKDELERAGKGLATHESATIGFRVVDAYDKELATGLPHCSCCQKPLTASECR